ncbi:Store-operated calcium entry-associated regulatory factor [Porites harrisoni]
MAVSRSFVRLWIIFLFGSHLITAALGWGSSDKIKLTDVNVITLQQGRMTNSRRTHPVPQLQCVGGTAGCSAFTPRVVQCYNRGSDGYDVQWECKADMDSSYRFGDIAVNCEGYNYPDDPYILKGSCGLEYTIDVVDGGNNYHYSGHRDHGHHGYSHNYYSRRHSGSWIGTIIMWAIIALIAYYIYQHWTGNNAGHTQTPGGYSQSTSPPPPGFRPEYTMPGSEHTTTYATPTSAGTGGGFWSGAATGGLLGYLFGSSGHRNQYYNGHGYYGPRYHQPGPGYGFGGSSWFGSNNSWTSGWSSSGTHRRSPSPPSTRTASGFGGTKRR